MLFSPSHRKRKRLQLRVSERRLLLMAGDTLAVIAAVLFSLWLWARRDSIPFELDFILPQTIWFFALSLLWVLLAGANDFYELPVAASRTQSMSRLITITLQMGVVYLLVFFLSERDALPRLFIVYFGVTVFVLIAIWRLLNPALIGWASTPRRALVIGTDWTAETIINIINRPETAYEVKGVIGSAEEVGRSVANVPVIGTGADLLNFVTRDGISELILTSTREMPGDVFQGVMDAYERGLSVVPMPILYERLTERVPVEHIDANWTVVLPIDGNNLFNPYPLLKRFYELILTAVGLVLFALMLPLIALAIKLESPGPIFFTQRRVGRYGRVFKIIKFRTMVPDAEKLTGAVFAQKNDPRVTRVGRMLRKTRLDEIPQFLNILRGDMSLVGPRPERPEHVERLQQSIPFYRTRHVVRPGVTGWAQVRYDYGENDEDALVKLQYDLYYIRHQSLMLDVNILLRTVGKVLRMVGQ